MKLDSIKLFDILKKIDPSFKNCINENASSALNEHRKLSDIAREIYNDWKPISPYAKPYLDAMSQLNSIDDKYIYDDGRTIVTYFLSNASGWKGENAKRIKNELKKMLGLKESIDNSDESKYSNWFNNKQNDFDEFYVDLFKLFNKADLVNKVKLQQAFPDYISINDINNNQIDIINKSNDNKSKKNKEIQISGEKESKLLLDFANKHNLKIKLVKYKHGATEANIKRKSFDLVDSNNNLLVNIEPKSYNENSIYGKIKWLVHDYTSKPYKSYYINSLKELSKVLGDFTVFNNTGFKRYD